MKCSPHLKLRVDSSNDVASFSVSWIVNVFNHSEDVHASSFKNSTYRENLEKVKMVSCGKAEVFHWSTVAPELKKRTQSSMCCTPDFIVV